MMPTTFRSGRIFLEIDNFDGIRSIPSYLKLHPVWLQDCDVPFVGDSLWRVRTLGT